MFGLLRSLIGSSAEAQARATAQQMQRNAEEHQWSNAMMADGWRQVGHTDHPARHDLVEITRFGWDKRPQVVNWSDLPRQMNIYGLWWRPWRGEKIEGEIIDVEAVEVPADRKLITSGGT
jgi:hypothetical protein